MSMNNIRKVQSNLVDAKIRFGFSPTIIDRQELRACIEYHGDLYIAGIDNIWKLRKNFELEKVVEEEGRQSNALRFYHDATDKVALGSWVIDDEGVHPVGQVNGRYQAWCACEHRTDPDTLIHVGSSDELCELNPKTQEVSLVTDLWVTGHRHVFDLEKYGGNIYVASSADGLYYWDGSSWTQVEAGKYRALHALREGGALIAFGWDNRSAFLNFTTDGTSWTKYRLPKAHDFWGNTDDTNTRIRHVHPHATVADLFGICYIVTDSYDTPGVPETFIPKPMGNHLSAFEDFTIWRGKLAVLGMSNWYASHERSGVDSGLRVITLEDLYRMGKPHGHGGVWKDTSVSAGETSDPFLINGFDQKTLHLETDGATDFTIQVDPIGDKSWKDYDMVPFGGAGYDEYIMSGDGVWVRIKSSDAVTATVWFNVR